MAVSGTAAVAGAVVAQRYGHGTQTDGFFAAYAIYLVLVLAAQAFRLVVVPDLTRAAGQGRLAIEARGYLAAFLALAVPVSAAAILLRGPLGDTITGAAPPAAAHMASRTLVWIVPASFGQLLAAVAVSALAARGSYGVAAAGYAVGGVAALVVFLSLEGSHGLIALAWGVTCNSAIALGVPLVALGRIGGRSAVGWHGLDVLPRLWRLVRGTAVPLALQALYLIGLAYAADLGVGKPTILAYAYLLAATLVAATASSLSLVSSEPLTRRGIDAESAADHVIHSAWLSLALIAAAAGVMALVGGQLVHGVLGSSFGGAAGGELGNLVVWFAPWMIASVAFSVTYPLLFVLEPPRLLMPLALGALVVHVPVTLTLRALFGLPGIAVALAVTTFAVLFTMMAAVSRRMLVVSAVELVKLALVLAAITVVAFGGPSLFVPRVAAAVVGLVLYAALLGAVRPRGLREAWSYVRTLH